MTFSLPNGTTNLGDGERKVSDQTLTRHVAGHLMAAHQRLVQCVKALRNDCDQYHRQVDALCAERNALLARLHEIQAQEKLK